MKKAFVLLLNFLLYFVFSTFLFVLVFIIYKSCINTVFGSRGFSVSFTEVLVFALKAVPVSAIVSICSVFLKCASTRNFFWGSALVIIFIILAAFGGIIPLSFVAGNKLSVGTAALPVNNSGSRYDENVFAVVDGDVYYFTTINANGGSGLRKVYLDDRRFFEVYKNKTLPTGVSPDAQQTAFSEELQIPGFLALIQKIIQNYVAVLKKAWSDGWLAYLPVALIAVGLFSLWGILFFTSWKLLDSLFLCAGCVVVFYLNYLLITPSFFDKVRTFVFQKLGAGAASPLVISAALNIILLVGFLLGGLFSFIFHRKKYAGTEI